MALALVSTVNVTHTTNLEYKTLENILYISLSITYPWWEYVVLSEKCKKKKDEFF